jgi:ribosomal protein S6
MKHYELSSLVSSQLSEEEIKIFSEKLSALVKSEGGEAIEAKLPTRRKIGYMIKHEKQAWFSIINFDMEPEKIEGLQTQLKSLPEILRFMLVNRKPISEIFEEQPREFKQKPAEIKEQKEEKGEEEKPKMKEAKKEKVELEEIDKKLEEILGEN